MSLVMKRTSIRKYTNEAVSKEDVKKLLQSGMQAPSARNRQPWEFIVVDDRKLLDSLSESAPGAWMLKDAPLAIIPLLIEDTDTYLFNQQDLGAVTQNILLEATNLGLGAVWIGCYPREERYTYVQKVLNIKKGFPFSIIAIGHPLEEKAVSIRYDESRVHYNKLGD